MADLLCHRSFFSCKDNTLNVCINNNNNNRNITDNTGLYRQFSTRRVIGLNLQYKFNISFLTKNRDSATMAMVPLYMMVYSQVAVLLPVDAAHPMCFNILEKTARTIHTHSKSLKTFNIYQIPIKEADWISAQQLYDPRKAPDLIIFSSTSR